MLQRWDSLLELLNLRAKTAVIEKPGSRDVVHVLDAGIGGVARIHWHPGSAGAHQAEHADEHARVIGRINRRAVFISQTFRAHRACDLLAECAYFAVRIAARAVENRDAIEVCFSAFVEI